MAILDKLQPANAELHIILVPSLTEYPPLSSLGASNSFLPSLLYFTPHSSIKASFNSSSVISVDKSSIVWDGIGFSPINNLQEHAESSFLANASMKRE